MVAHGWNADKLHRIRLGPVCPGRGEYINTLLGPERTDVLSRQDNTIRSDLRSYREGFSGSFRLVRVKVSGGCVV